MAPIAAIMTKSHQRSNPKDGKVKGKVSVYKDKPQSELLQLIRRDQTLKILLSNPVFYVTLQFCLNKDRKGCKTIENVIQC